MLTPPSPSRSPSLTPNDQASRKRQRSESMDSQPSSSSKRSISVDPSLTPSQSHDIVSVSLAEVTLDADIDAYMVVQGEATIPATLDESTQQDSSVTSSDFSGAQKLALIDGLCNNPMVAGTTWYLVSRRWWKRWRKACTGEVDKEGAVVEAELGPVDNSNLVDSAGNIVTPPTEHVDVEFVSEQAWGKLVSWYGQPEWPLPRKVITRGFMNEASLEIMPPRLKVHLLVRESQLSPPPAPAYVTVSIKDTVRSLSMTMAKAVGAADSSAPIRLWKLPEETDYPSLEYPVSELKQVGTLLDADGRKSIEDALINSGDAFVVEIRTDQGWLAPDPDSQVPVSETSTPQSTRLFGTPNFFDQLQAKSSPTSSVELSKPDSSPFKPASAMKSKYNVQVKASKIDPGTLGLSNLGNTCFMNSAIQCLAHTKELMEYFLTGVFEEELNPDNPLGMHGDIAKTFGALSRRIWDTSAPNSSYSPREFKQVLQKFAPQFGGYQQHDTQEFVAFLLDGLHEDLNRVLKKPYVEKPDWEGGGDKELVTLAKESWDGYMRRNDSVIVDLFQGQYQSTLVCPECQKVSITFDPFMYLTLPLPIQKKWMHDVFYIPWDITKPHVKIPVELNREASFKEVRQVLARWMDTNPDHLVTLEIFSNRFYKDLTDHVAWGDMQDNDIIVCYELPCPSFQGKQRKRQEGDPYIVPVFMCDTIRPAPRTFMNNGPFGYPFFIVVDEQAARDQEAMYNLILERLERWTENARELSTWEEGSPYDSLEGSLEEVPIPISSGAPDSTVEINENGDVVPVEQSPPEEGDIADQKGTVIRDAEEDAVEIKLGEPRRIGFKKDIFQLHLASASSPYGVGFSTFGSTHFIDWGMREQRAQDGNSSSLIEPNDVFVCEFDSGMKTFYFLDSARWDKWEELVHPEFKASREAAKAAKKKSISLQDCLDEFTKEEQLGEDDLWYCPRCKKHQQATKRFDLWKVPDILVVHLKRFSNNRSLRDKIDAFVDFPLEGLDLTPMIGERQAAKRLAEQGVDITSLGIDGNGEPLVYDLYAVDEHLGGMGGGHYRAYAHNHMTDKWYHFDDSHVTPSLPSNAINSNAYLLFYKRRSSFPLGGKSHEKIEAARQRPRAPSPAQRVEAEETQLPTPPSETRLIPLPGLSDINPGWITPPTRSSSASRGSSPPPLDDIEDPPAFDQAGFDPLLLSSQRFDMPDPAPSPSLPSPSSSLEVDMDSDLEAAANTDKHRQRWSPPPFTVPGYVNPDPMDDDDEMNRV
ncbi:cysteine proteinase [Cristinia sonorae]|uniref:ubiquitinyl hydrolase 1 n=1 Tax=Cristinia sonorae TaxID=1940300 RepID=A0A8K0UKV5_9AGAR|nr:cysteine proteinase [Cristinia sonorae]